MLHTLLSLLFTLQPFTPVIADRCDLVEVNHLYDEDARHIFTQTIYFDWCDETCRFQVRAWRLVKRQSLMPAKGGDVFRASWIENGDTLRSVSAKAFRESWTQYDPELIERDVLPSGDRRDLGARP